MSQIRLIPYKVDQIVDKTTEIPQGVALIEAPSMWEKGYMGNSVVVAVLDTGCDIEHPDLKDRIIDGRNFTNDYGGDVLNFDDNQYHGTHVAGTIAATLNNNGVVGVAPEVKLLILKVLSKDGSGSYKGLIDALEYAINWRGPDGEKVRVISMSLGGPENVPSLHTAIKNAVNNDILVVCAAGNEGDGNVNTIERSYPGYYDEVVSVGAVDFDKRLADFTNTHEEIDLVAPGVKVLSTYPNNKYARLSGTSMATPHVSGAAALLLNEKEKELGRKICEHELYDILIEHTQPIGYSRHAEGNGLLYLGNKQLAE
ncbi:S8 family peptidase [Cytobacillus sp. IB215665]|uniref:S8 family peptidase n=1 Tax=Cytobacillus sp. IB215665 TaxID=3097357 RepID=UPI002A15AC6C|nr:S8 family peptidase [Cytobacillus sp. IB215665]MDX8366157.1 S8 family peptidase [Cytobacillus sp. IB215665]